MMKREFFKVRRSRPKTHGYRSNSKLTLRSIESSMEKECRKFLKSKKPEQQALIMARLKHLATVHSYLHRNPELLRKG